MNTSNRAARCDLASYLADLASRVPDEHERSRHVFEPMIDRLITNDHSVFERWVSCGPGPSIDLGVDREAVDRDGNRWAVQVRCYVPGTRVSTATIDSLVGSRPPERYMGKILIASTDRVVRHGLTKLAANPVELLLHDDLDALGIDWWALEDLFQPLRRVAHRTRLRPDQERAVEETTAALRPIGARVQIRRVAGSGVTVIMERIAERFGLTAGSAAAPLVVVVAPTITLANRSIAVWRAELGREMPATLGVWADTDTCEEDRDVTVRGVEATSDADEIVRWLTVHQGRPRLVISTHPALSRLVGALADARVRADVAFVSDARRVTGSALGAATPFARIVLATSPPHDIVRSGRIVDEPEGVSVGDASRFGQPAHSYTFCDAVADGVLGDYRVDVVVVTDADLAEIALPDGADTVVLRDDDEVRMPIRQLVAHLAIGHAVDAFGLRTALAFHDSIATSKRWARDHEKVATALGHPATVVRHVDGTYTTAQRRQVLDELDRHAGTGGFVVSNARLLVEAGSVPAVDAVAFLAPQASAVEFGHTLARALRASAGRRVLRIVVPVHAAGTVGHGGTPSFDDSGESWATAQPVVDALRRFDPTLATASDVAGSVVSERVRCEHPRSVTRARLRCSRAD